MKKITLLFIILIWLVLYGHGQKSHVILVDKSNDWRRDTIYKGYWVYVKADTALFLCLKNIPPYTPVKNATNTSLIQWHSRAKITSIIRVKSALGEWLEAHRPSKGKTCVTQLQVRPLPSAQK